MPDRRVRRSRLHLLSIALGAALPAAAPAPAAAQDAFEAGLTGAFESRERQQADLAGVTLRYGTTGFRRSDKEDVGSSRPNAGNRYERGDYVGLAAEIGERWLADLTYTIYAGWTDENPESEEIALAGGYTARGLFGFDQLSLTPQLKFTVPIDDGEKYYSEIRVTPALAFLQDRNMPVDVSMPITLGVGFDDDHRTESDRTGYVGVGLNSAMTFTAIPQGYGNLTLSADVDFLLRDGNAEAPNRDGEDFVTIGGLRLRLAY